MYPGLPPHPAAAVICGERKAETQLGTVLGGKFPFPTTLIPFEKSPF
jgi:hypothetical protein